jgi:hypothetical protein
MELNPPAAAPVQAQVQVQTLVRAQNLNLDLALDPSQVALLLPGLDRVLIGAHSQIASSYY